MKEVTENIADTNKRYRIQYLYILPQNKLG
jgi:hypothetical protein